MLEYGWKPSPMIQDIIKNTSMETPVHWSEIILLCVQGFIYISSVIEEDNSGAASVRSGLRALYKEAERASKLLVISRVSNEKVLPWMVSSSGAIRCFDTVSLSHKLSLHRHALRPILMHVLMWEQPSAALSSGVERLRDAPRPSFPLPPSPPSEQLQNLVLDDASQAALGRDTAGDVSFRFHDFSFPNSWVWLSVYFARLSLCTYTVMVPLSRPLVSLSHLWWIKEMLIVD